MGSTLLSLTQSACAELGLAVPGIVAGATDAQTVQMLALMNAVGADLLTRAQWTALQTQAVINVPAVTQTTGLVVSGDAYVYNMPTFPTGPVTSFILSGDGIPTSARGVDSASGPGGITVEIDMEATASGTDVAITIARDTFDVPADFDGFINDTEWDRGNHWRLQGPSSPQEDQWMRSGIVTTGPRRWFRQVGRGVDVFRIWPPPGLGDDPGPLVYEYLSRYWALDGSTPIARFTSDTDTCVFNDRLMIEGLKWRFFASKGFDYASSFAIWNRQIQTAIARDGGAPMLDMARRRYPVLISPYNVQSGNFPGR